MSAHINGFNKIRIVKRLHRLIGGKNYQYEELRSRYLDDLGACVRRIDELEATVKEQSDAERHYEAIKSELRRVNEQSRAIEGLYARDTAEIIGKLVVEHLKAKD